MRLLKSIVLVFGLLSIASFATNAYYSDQVTVTNNEFSTGTWEDVSNQIRICHATGAEGNYQNISPSKNGVLNGHDKHGDIIPPFDYGYPVEHFDGLNWDTQNQAIYNNNCETVSVLPTSSI